MFVYTASRALLGGSVFQRQTIQKAIRSIYSHSTWVSAFAPDGDRVQWAVLQKKSSGFLLHAYGVDHSSEQASATVHGIAKDAQYTVSVLPSSVTLSRQIHLPPLPPKDLDAAVIDMLDQTLAVGIEGGCIAYESIAQDETSQTLNTYLAKQQAVEEHIAQIQRLEIDPEWVFPKASCLGSFISYFSLNGWQHIIDIGLSEITIVLVFDGRVVESRSIVGRSEIFANLNAPDAARDEQLRQLLQHLAETVWAYTERYEITDGSLTVTGDVLSHPLATSLISEFISIPLSAIHTTSTDVSVLKSAAAIGAAFLTQRPGIIPNFRVKTLAFSNPLLHWKRPLLSFCIGCLIMAALIVWYGERRAESIISDMRDDWTTITKTAHTTPEEVTSLTGQVIQGRPTSQTTPDQIVTQGKWLLTSLEKKASFPLQPNLPRFMDVIGWVSQLIKEAASMPPMENEKCDVLNLSYQMVKRPTKNHPKEKYQIRVDLEFSTPSVALARSLHDRLTSNALWIDQSSEIKWMPGNGKYRVSFFLRDKTIYPPQNP